MNPQSQYSENHVLMESLKKALQGREDELMRIFIQEGPEEMRKRLKIRGEGDWQMIFNYMVLRTDALKNCVLEFMPFFKNLVEEKGPIALREIFNLQKSEYDPAFQKIFRIVCICEGAIFHYIRRNKQALTQKILDGKGGEIRAELCLESHEYSRLWMDILDILKENVCSRIATETQVEHGLQAFSMLMNSLRTQRSLKSYKKTWEYSEEKKGA